MQEKMITKLTSKIHLVFWAMAATYSVGTTAAKDNKPYPQKQMTERQQIMREAAQLEHEIQTLAHQNQSLRQILQQKQALLSTIGSAEDAKDESQNSDAFSLEFNRKKDVPVQAILIVPETIPEDKLIAPQEDSGIAIENADIVMHSRTLDKKIPMKEVADGVYEAQVLIAAGIEKAYFDVNQKRYKGSFPRSDKPQTFIFTLDQSNELRPRMDIRLKENEHIVVNDAPL